MLITRLYLRNYRVYEQELELELPSGLVGVYGPNGSGKSTLLESMLFAIWGRARTTKDLVRTSGVGGDCVTEVEFEHEGHLYLVRRTITGINSTVKAEAHCDRLLVAEGVKDTGRYLHQVLGMDDAAFRASVFAEQKQLAAFSSQRPEERRRLVLQLLGITPLDAARDTARRDAREAEGQHGRLRGMLPDLDVLEVAAADADAAASAREVEAEQSILAANAALERAAQADAAFARLDLVRQEYEGLVIEGRGVKAELDGAVARVTALEAELAELDAAAGQVAALAPAAEGLAGAEGRLRLVDAVASAAATLASVTVPAEPPEVDEVELEAARLASEVAGAAVAGIEGELRAAGQQLATAKDHAARSAQLSGEADCPLCGQALGAAFEQVQAHRAAEVEEAAQRLAQLEAGRTALLAEATAAQAAFTERSRCTKEHRAARSKWEQAVARRTAAEEALRAAVDAAGGIDAATAADDAARLHAEVETRRQAAAALARLQGRLDRRPALEADLDSARDKAAGATGRVETLRDKVRALGFDAPALDEARRHREILRADADAAASAAQAARVDAGRTRALAEGEAKRAEDARAQHARLADLESESRHLSRLAELLNAFRNGVVATVGPRLAVQAADLFGELTDREYDRLEVDPETYELQIRDAGQVYGLDRFSGSEIDLANLALRVAISEHVRFQSGGSVGLLVLDEVFGPLDEDRKARMLLALERLRGRFRQVLVVTHDTEIKEQLPNAIEVVKLPGRRATARVLNGS
jgi:DNA repair protein SbcC/Rad50